MRTIVVLPAPLGPSRAKIAPSVTVRSTPSRATWSPKDLRTARALIASAEVLIVTGFLAFSGAVGCRGVHRRRAAPHGGLSSPSPAQAAVPPGTPRMPPSPAAPPSARAGHRPAAPVLRAPDQPAPGTRS